MHAWSFANCFPSQTQAATKALSPSLLYYRQCVRFPTTGHGADVKCVDWHPRKNLLVSGSKDNQQPIKLWDAKAGQSVSTM